jgi:hypothetical protein
MEVGGFPHPSNKTYHYNKMKKKIITLSEQFQKQASES